MGQQNRVSVTSSQGLGGPAEEQPTPSIDRRGSLRLLTSALTGVGNTDYIYITLAQQVMI